MSRFTKAEKSWIMYDWANSVYATIIMAAVFPIYFAGVAKANGIAGDVWWGYATSAASLLIALSSPFLGAIGDFKGMKKRLLSLFLLIGVFFTLLMAVVDQPVLMLIGYFFSFIGFEGTILFYDSFLTDITTKERMDRVSSYGFAMGYIGGSTIPFLMSIALILFGERIGIDGVLAVKISVVITALWWALFSMPLLRHVRQQHYVETPPSRLIRHALSNLKKTIGGIFRQKKTFYFLIAYFFYIDGVGTVITMSTSYGSTLGLGSTGMILALLLTQILAVPFSILFGRFAGTFGTRRMIQGGVLVYMLVCLLGFYMGFSLEPHQRAYEEAFTSAVDRANAPLDAETLNEVKVRGVSILSESDRVQAFDGIIADLSESRNRAEQAGLEALKTAVTPFLSDDVRARDYTDALQFSTMLFWLLAVLVSTSQGGIQALSRSFFSKLIPPERSNEHFGFFDIFGKFASVLGPALYALAADATGRSSIGILSLLILFGIGFAAMSKCK